MSIRRTAHILGVVGVVAAVTLIGPAAGAHHQIDFIECAYPEPTLTPPPQGSPSAPPTPYDPPPPEPEPELPDGCVPASEMEVREVQQVRFDVAGSFTRPIAAVTATVVAEEEGLPSPDDPLGSWSFAFDADPPAEQSFVTTWPAGVMPNGIYTFRVEASTHGPHPDGQSTAVRERNGIIIDVAPQTPQAPTVVSVRGNAITVEWPAIEAPDLLSYDVYRARTDSFQKVPFWSQFELAGVVSTSVYRETVAGDGAYWYRVAATRRSAVTPDEGISSGISGRSEPASIVTEVPKAKGTPTPKPKTLEELLPDANRRAPPTRDAPVVLDLPVAAPGSFAQPAERPDQQAADAPEPGAVDPRGNVLPVAVGSFLVSAALVLGRMPYGRA